MPALGLHEAVLDCLPSGLIVIDLNGAVIVLNQAAQKILGLKGGHWRDKPCREVFQTHRSIAEILLRTAETLVAANRQEMRLANPRGAVMVLGYGTLVFRNDKGEPMGVGMICQDITRFVPIPLTAQFISLINKFFTPFVAITVVAALIWGLAQNWEKGVAAVILVGIAIFNWVMAKMAARPSGIFLTLVRLHTPLNFIAFSALVYFLGTLWGPMWLLFVLIPLATSLYAGRGTTLAVSVISAVVLLAIYDSRGLSGSVGWAQAFLHAVFIVFISLFVQALTTLVSRTRGVS